MWKQKFNYTCTLCYPTKPVNLKAISTIKKFPNALVGLSDHTLGIDVATASIPWCFSYWKHFTFNNKLKKCRSLVINITRRFKNIKRCNLLMKQWIQKNVLKWSKTRKFASIVSKYN